MIKMVSSLVIHQAFCIWPRVLMVVLVPYLQQQETTRSLKPS
ncbi:unnamed protein product [Arabidopsis halleri]